MRLWSVHPRYLDTAGLTACWREALLAQKVLIGATRGYRHHPQLQRFLPGSVLELAHRAAAAAPPVVAASTIPPDAVLPGTGPAESWGTDDLRAAWPGDLVVAYLHAVADEADARGFAFDRSRIAGPRPVLVVEVTEGQVAYEWARLRAKLADRSPDVLARWAGVVRPDPHACFVVVPGAVAPWEVVPGA